MESLPNPAPPTGIDTSSREADPVSDGRDLVSRLEVIEAQPLSVRADAYGSIHDEFSARLDADVTGRASRS